MKQYVALLTINQHAMNTSLKRKNHSYLTLFVLVLIVIGLISCGQKKEEALNNEEKVTTLYESSNNTDTYTNPLLEVGAEPWAIFHEGYYYYTHGSEDRILIWKTKDITDIANVEPDTVWIPKDKKNAFHLWGPEIHRINNKWYIYFSADDGQTDNHQIYVIENENDDPLQGDFVMKGRIQTDKESNWAIHASVFEHKNELYMVWSGWQTRRIEIENQNIYIAKMKNPWELSSERVVISRPEYEWERQWINPDGTKTAYPIFVNEEPQYFQTKNKDKVLIYYSASGNWTPYYAVGLLWADFDSDLLDAANWKKSATPVFKQHNGVHSTGSVSFIPSPSGDEDFFLYHARHVTKHQPGNIENRSPRLQKIEWDKQGFPILGYPFPVDTVLQKPK